MVDWLRDELIVVTNAVRINDWKGLRASSVAAQRLSELLSTGQLHPASSFPSSFRSPNSIQRKSYDLATRHPDYSGKPTRGGLLDKVIVNEALKEPVVFHTLALAIEAAIQEAVSVNEAEAGTADEGGILLARHVRRERDAKLRQAKIGSSRGEDGSLACEVCGFDFERAYGTRGHDYIEVHHRTPLHVSGPVSTQLGDLALLCANCHRMVHRRPWIPPDELVMTPR